MAFQLYNIVHKLAKVKGYMNQLHYESAQAPTHLLAKDSSQHELIQRKGKLFFFTQ